ncbi:hypothetical protein JMJ55_10965 [Belnapia sp. T6]|uniref:DUF1150 family protein n=1 Tax=Belnapia mucosa TaxID=2804532 RepID=A0ABS1V2D1_9PROT|nr:hypothetical protein [Belnapia mucosa]MBL6455844.1 hypothetical protein [Belnapia mucosa]
MKNNESSNGSGASAQAAVALRQLSVQDWARFGVQEIAYIRPVVVNGVPAVSIHAADGTPIGAAPNTELAVAALEEHELAAVLVH